MRADQDAVPASALGILRCLQLLTEEACSLDLHNTVRALEKASQTIVSESRAARETYPAAMH